MFTRRSFLQSSLTFALVPLLSRPSWSTTTPVAIRPSWQTFSSGPLLSVYMQTVATMRANSNYNDPNSWSYWANVHKNNCPHGKPYFMAWHRGFLSRFESRLRMVSGNSQLVLPYWDYYTDATLPPEYLDDTSPLWRRGRTSDNVAGALSWDAFADTIVNFPRGFADAFEPTLETAPHNPVHNLIGGAMANVTVSPFDPIFWVHHANIDRLWSAWVQAGNGRTMPSTSDPYWTGSFNYGPAIRSMPRAWTYSTTSTYLDYQYDDLSMPQAPPPATSTVVRPASLALAPTAPQPTTTGVSVGGVQQLTLDHRSVSIDVPLVAQDRNRIRSLLLAPATNGTQAGNSIRVVLDDVRLTELGKAGGYFYKVYIDLPPQGGVMRDERRYLLGMLGSFEITAARMRMQMAGRTGASGMAMGGMPRPDANAPLRMDLDATAVLRRIWPQALDKLTISFVRVDGSRPARGATITAKALRIETSG